MENFRKIIKFGKSSYVISLPNAWIRKNKLNKGDSINLNENHRNELVISNSENESKKEVTEIMLDFKGKELKEIQREIVSNYINGYDIIKIKTFSENLKGIRDVVYSLIGMEIVEQEEDFLVVKCLLSIKEVSMQQYLRRMDNIIRAMLLDSQSTKDSLSYERVHDRDRDVNRISFLLLRMIKIAINNPGSGYTVSYTVQDFFNMWTLVINLEGIADECKRISKLYAKLRKSKVDFKQFDSLYNDLVNYYSEIMKAYYKKDKALAYKIASESRNIFNHYESLLGKAKYVYEASMIEKFKNMSSNIRGVARVVYEW